MPLVTVTLPSLSTLRGPWAALAAVCAARDWGSSAHAKGPLWHFDDGGGNWADVHLLPGGRAVLLGNDHEYSETYYGPAAEYFGEPETDLLAGAPDWWREPLPAYLAGDQWFGFVHGWDGQRWQRAEYDLDDGLHSIGVPGVDPDDTAGLIAQFALAAPGNNGTRPPRGVVDALIAADGAVTPSQLEAVLGGPGWDVAAGVSAANAFLTEAI